MGLAGAGFGASQALAEEQERRLREFAVKEQARIAQAALEQRALEERNRQAEVSQLRQLKLDELQRIADTEGQQKRTMGNLAGLVDMGVDPEVGRREATGAVLRGGDPSMLRVIEGLYPIAKPERDPIADYRSRKVIDQEFETPPRPERDPIADHEAKLKLDAKYKTGQGDAGPSPYATERAERTVQSVDELLGKVSRWNTGMGSILSVIPETDATNFASELDTLKANIAFNELAQMREASKTGGALGAVSERELALLESTLGALNPKQSPANLKSQLQKVKDSIQRWQAARSGGGATPLPRRPIPGIPGGEAELRDGKWIRVK